MNFKGITTAIIMIMLTATCYNKSQSDDSTLQVTGTLEAIQMTSWQYGTHTINTDTIFYALRSENTDLEPFVGKTVTITATIIEGYPVDGGPEFLEVKEVKEN